MARDSGHLPLDLLPNRTLHSWLSLLQTCKRNQSGVTANKQIKETYYFTYLRLFLPCRAARVPVTSSTQWHQIEKKTEKERNVDRRYCRLGSSTYWRCSQDKTQLDSCSMYQQHGTLRETTQHNLPVARNPAVKPIVTKKLIVSTWDRNATRRAVVNSTGE